MSALAPREIPVFVVAMPGTLLLDIAGPMEVLRKANLEQGALRFAVRYVGPTPEVPSSIGLALTGIEPLPDALPDGAILVLPGSAELPLAGTGPDSEQNRACRDRIAAWLADVVQPGIRLICICSGALIAARAGLLDGRDCTTHHGCIAELAQAAPSARVLENRLYVEDGEVLTSAGITAGIDLMLHLVAQMVGPACALAVARYLVVYLRRGGGDPQLSPWLEGRNHIHPAVHRAQDAVAAEPGRNWSLAALAKVAGTSSRNLSRLFGEHAGLSVSDYVSRMRVALAREIVLGSRADMESVAEKAGFASSRQLRRAWRRFHDEPPSRLRDLAGESGSIPPRSGRHRPSAGGR